MILILKNNDKPVSEIEQVNSISVVKKNRYLMVVNS